MRRSSWYLVGALLAGAFPLTASGQRTGLVPKSWELDFQFHDPQRIVVTLPGSNEPKTFWYIVYSVVNRTGQDVMFLPSFRLVTDTLDVTQAGDAVPPVVYDRIAARHRADFPFFAPPHKVTGKLLQGEEHGRSSAAVFLPFDPNAAGFRIHVGGLSGEMERVPNYAFDPDKPICSKENPQFFLLRRALEIRYDLPGDVETRSRATPIRRSRTWVLTEP